MIGIILEGIGEIDAVSEYLQRVQTTARLIGRPLRADMQPKANPLVIARSAKTAVNQLVNRGAKKIVILIDLEDNPCVLKMSRDLERAFSSMYQAAEFAVVVKNRCIENWLIADPEALEAMPRRFERVERIRKAVENDRADCVSNPSRLLDQCAQGSDYHKTLDPARIAKYQDIQRVALNSRSFRKFLRVVTHRNYANQSKKP